MFPDILEFLSYLLLVLLLRSILKTFLSHRRRAPSARSAPRQAPIQSGGELKKDPVCGTYVSVATGFTRSINGQVFYFCSKECRDRYGLQ